MKRCLILLLAIGALACGVPLVYAQVDTLATPIERTLVQLPVPAGFADPSRELPQIRQLGERETPASNRLLAIFMSQADINSALAGQQPAMARYFMAQTLRQTESSQISEAEFAQVKTLQRQQYQSLLAATKYRLQAGEKVSEVPMAMGITTAVFKGKLVYFYAYSVYQSPADFEWVRSATRTWLPLAASSNPP